VRLQKAAGQSVYRGAAWTTECGRFSRKRRRGSNGARAARGILAVEMEVGRSLCVRHGQKRPRRVCCFWPTSQPTRMGGHGRVILRRARNDGEEPRLRSEVIAASGNARPGAASSEGGAHPDEALGLAFLRPSR